MEEVDLILYSDQLVTCLGNGKPRAGREMNDVGLQRNAAVAVKDGLVFKVGSRAEVEESCCLTGRGRKVYGDDLTVLPGLVDSHTHPVFAGSRVKEFTMRAQGATYQEIHAAGGGIQFTVDSTRAASAEELHRLAKNNLMKMLEHGTTTVEAKSGYGLSTEEELRELRLIKRLSGELPLDVVPTFMGAHSIPREYTGRREEYVDSVIGEMLPQVNRLGLASFVDVFCEEGAFTLNETARILSAAKEMGFGLKLHGEEFTRLGSALMAAKMGAVSVDHLLRLSDGDISEIARTGTIFTLMPGTLFFLGYHEYAPARKIIDAGGSVCLATDFNAGSCMSRSMQMAMSLGCIAMKMTPGEAITAATYNGAYAVGMGDMAGSIQEGKQADLVVFSVDDYRMIPYHFGENLVKMVIKKGQVVLER
jgi:imidazolonepropionase